MQRIVISIAISCLVAPAAAKPKFTSFDPPGAVSTTPTGINSAGDVTGYFLDQNSAKHGFERLADGTFQVFDLPNDLSGTTPAGINDKREISGSWANGTTIAQGFLRSPSGILTVTNPLGSSGALLGGINNKGQAPGTFFNGTTTEGFIVKNDKFQTFSVLDANRTSATATNDNGVVVGTYSSAGDQKTHMYTRDKKGRAKAFDVPNDGGPYPVAISLTGYIVGSYTANVDGDIASFERAPNKSLKIISPSRTARNIFVTAVTDDGTAVGYYLSVDGNIHGYSAPFSGRATTINYPNVTTFTQVWGINSSGVMIGSYKDSSLLQHGFLRTR